VMGVPRGDVLLAERADMLSRLRFPSENHHRAGHTGASDQRPLVDMGRRRVGFGLRGSSAGRKSGAAAARASLRSAASPVVKPQLARLPVTLLARLRMGL
jgi:hypothetical protein